MDILSSCNSFNQLAQQCPIGTYSIALRMYWMYPLLARQQPGTAKSIQRLGVAGQLQTETELGYRFVIGARTFPSFVRGGPGIVQAKSKWYPSRS